MMRRLFLDAVLFCYRGGTADRQRKKPSVSLVWLQSHLHVEVIIQQWRWKNECVAVAVHALCYYSLTHTHGCASQAAEKGPNKKVKPN